VKLSDDADAALADLEIAGPPYLANAVYDVLDRIKDNPGDTAVRRHQWTTLEGRVWVVRIVAGRYDWIVIWHSRNGEQEVLYIGAGL
jgi:hypothetical protein